MELLAALGAGFLVVFSVFVVAFVGLMVYIAVWAIRRDAASRRAWYRALGGRDEDAGVGDEDPTAP
jgi:hypothetical protein